MNPRTALRALVTMALLGVAVMAASSTLAQVRTKFLGASLKQKSFTEKEVNSLSSSIQSKNNEIKNLLNQYTLSKKPATKSVAFKKLKLSLENRKKTMGDLICSSPKRAIAQAILDSLRNSLPLEVRGLVEKKTTTRGVLEIIYDESFETGEGRAFYFITNQEGRTPLCLDAAIPNQKVGGNVIEVSGISLANVGFAADHITSAENSTAEPEPPAEEKVAVILVKFTDTPGPETFPNEIEALNDLIFNNDVSARSYFPEVSYGKTTLTGTTVWIELPNTFEYYSNLPGNGYAQEIVNAADLQIDWTGYGHIVSFVHFQDLCHGSGTTNKINFETEEGPIQASFAELTSISDCDNDIRIFLHELLHGFGLQHGGGWICPLIVGENLEDPQVGCGTPAYGDDFDPMGQHTRHLSLFRKEQLGWLEPVQIQTVSSSGNYTLEVMETVGSGVKQLKIPLGGNKYYSIEYRRPVGPFDSWGGNPPDGVFMRFIPENMGCNPSGNCWNSLLPKDLVINPDSLFYDTYRHISIQMIEKSDQQAMLAIDLASTKSDFTIESVSFSPENPAAGDPITFQAVVKNKGHDVSSSATKLFINLNNDETAEDIVLERSTGALAFNATTTELFENAWTDDGGGNHSFRICADANEVWQELSETNNCVSGDFSVSPSLPDLIVSSLTITTSGSQVIVTATVNNQGDAPSVATKIRFSSDFNNNGVWDYQNWINMGALEVGSSSQITTMKPIPPLQSAVTWRFDACVDPTEIVPGGQNLESNEDNNCSLPQSITIPPSSPPDLIVSSLTAYTLPGYGNYFVSLTINNQGESPATSSKTRLRVDSNNDGSWENTFFFSTGLIWNGAFLNMEDLTIGSPIPSIVQLEACADTPNPDFAWQPTVVESNEENNCLTQLVTISPP